MMMVDEEKTTSAKCFRFSFDCWHTLLSSNFVAKSVKFLSVYHQWSWWWCRWWCSSSNGLFICRNTTRSPSPPQHHHTPLLMASSVSCGGHYHHHHHNHCWKTDKNATTTTTTTVRKRSLSTSASASASRVSVSRHTGYHYQQHQLRQALFVMLITVNLVMSTILAASGDRGHHHHQHKHQHSNIIRPHRPPRSSTSSLQSASSVAVSTTIEGPYSNEHTNSDDASENHNHNHNHNRQHRNHHHHLDDNDEPEKVTEAIEEEVVYDPTEEETTAAADDPSNLSPSSSPQEDEEEEEEELDENDFCIENYVDSAYFNGYDTILTRGDRLWYYYKDQHRLSKAYDQRRFTQGDHIQGAFNVSRMPPCSSRTTTSSSSSSSASNSAVAASTTAALKGDRSELAKMRNMAVYFLHNKERSRSYYNLDVRHSNGTQKRVRSRDLPWGMKQVGLLGGNLWPNGWEAYQQYRPVAFLPSRYELIFVMNHYTSLPSHHEHHYSVLNANSSLLPDAYAHGVVGGSDFASSSSALLVWNNLDTSSWNSSWRSRVLPNHHQRPVVYTGMFEMNGIVYAIGESRHPTPDGKWQRMGKMYRYYVTENDSRDLRETDQSVRDFFGCPRRKEKVELTFLPLASMVNTTSRSQTLKPSQTSTTSTTTATTTTSTTTSAPATTSTTTTTTTSKAPSSKVSKLDRSSSSSSEDGNQTLVTTTSSSGNFANGSHHWPRLKSANVLLSGLPDQSSNQIYSSVFLRNSKAKILPGVHQIATAPNGTSTIIHLQPSTVPPSVTLRESDSILLTIFIGIVISACIATIILAFLTISGRSRKKLPPRFEGARIERTIPKPTIIGLDYHPRKSSSASSTHLNLMSRYDSMNSINAIYSQINKPNNIGIGNGNGNRSGQIVSATINNGHHQHRMSKKKKSKIKSYSSSTITNPYHTTTTAADRSLGGGTLMYAFGSNDESPPPPPPPAVVVSSSHHYHHHPKSQTQTTTTQQQQNLNSVSNVGINSRQTEAAILSGHLNGSITSFHHFDAYD